jgi:hypothetical protein
MDGHIQPVVDCGSGRAQIHRVGRISESMFRARDMNSGNKSEYLSEHDSSVSGVPSSFTHMPQLGYMFAQCIGVPSDFMHVNGGALTAFGDGGQSGFCRDGLALPAQDSGVQFGVTHTTGGYDGSFCIGPSKLPCCACVRVEASNRTNARVK